MFVVRVGALITTIYLAQDLSAGRSIAFDLSIALWLWSVALFAVFAEALAEGWGAARGDLVTHRSGDPIPGDGPEQGSTFLDRMVARVAGAKRQKTPNEIAVTLLLSGLTVVFLLAVLSLHPAAAYSAAEAGTPSMLTVPILIILLVCLTPTTVGRLLDARGIGGMARTAQRTVPVTRGCAVKATCLAGRRDQERVLHRRADTGAHYDGAYAVRHMMAGRPSSAGTMGMGSGRQ